MAELQATPKRNNNESYTRSDYNSTRHQVSWSIHITLHSNYSEAALHLAQDE